MVKEVQKYLLFVWSSILPLKNLMMSVKSMLFSRMMSRYVSTSARATKSTKCSEDVCLAAQMVSHRENTSSYTISARKGTIKVRWVYFALLFSSQLNNRKTSFKVQQEPAIAEVEVSVVSILLHQLEELRVQNLLVGWQKTSSGYTTTNTKEQINLFLEISPEWVSAYWQSVSPWRHREGSSGSSSSSAQWSSWMPSPLRNTNTHTHTHTF